jgi:hypothetical protein
MATYLQGVTDYIPQIQPFQPDLNLLQSVVETKQAQYRAGYDKISNVYGKLLNSELSRQDNINNRDLYFTQIKNDIEKISSMDLSKIENVDAAYNVFKPVIEDKYLQRDMVFTKSYNNQVGISNYFKNCMDEKECGGKWWDVGDTAMAYQKDEFIKASKDETLSMGNVEYVPYVNAFKTAYDAAVAMKDALKMKTVSTSPDGKWEITTTNGMQLVPSLSMYMSQAIGADPKVQRMFETQAYVDRKNYVMSKAAELGSEEAAEKQYITDILNAEADANKRRQEELAENNRVLDNNKTLIEENTEKYGVAPGADSDPVDIILGINQQKEIIASEKNKQDQITGLLDPTTNSISDIKTLRRKADMIRANNLNNDTMILAAKVYATNTFQQERKLDEEWKMNREHQLRLSEMRYKQSLEDKAAAKEEATLGESLGLNDGVISGALVPDEKIQVAEQLLSESANAEGTGLAISDNIHKQIFKTLNDVIDSPVSTPAQKEKAKEILEKTLGVLETEDYQATGNSWDQVWWEDWNELSPEEKQNKWGNDPNAFAKGWSQNTGFWSTTGDILTAVGRGIANVAEAGVETFQGNDKYTRVKKSGYVIKNQDGSYSFNGGGYQSDPNNAAANIKNSEMQKFKTNYNDERNYRNSSKNLKAAIESEDMKQLLYGSGYKTWSAGINTQLSNLDIAIQNHDDVSTAIKYNDQVALNYLQANGNYWAGQVTDPVSGYMMDKNSFIESYVKKQLEWKNTKDYPTQKILAKGEVVDISPDRINKMKSDAASIYDDLREDMWEVYKEGKANDKMRLATKPMGGTTMKGYQGIMYNADIAGGIDAFSNKLAADFYAKDLRRAFGKNPDINANFMFGDAPDIGEIANDEKAKRAAEEIFLDFLSASPKKSQGKDDRPRFSMTSYYTSKNDDNKVTVVIKPSEFYAKQHIGTDKKPGVTAGAYGEAGQPITIVMDKADVQALMFEEHKTTAMERKMNLTGRIDRNYGDIGSASITQDKDGYYSINGLVTSYENGQKTQIPLVEINSAFAPGALGPNTDLNAAVNLLDNFYANYAAYTDANIAALRKK